VGSRSKWVTFAREKVVGVDGSDLSTEATGYAFEQASQRGLGLTVVHAWDAKYRLEILERSAREREDAARLKRERAEGEQRVSLLRSDRVDPDMLEERARFQLDYANPHDLVRMVAPSARSAQSDSKN